MNGCPTNGTVAPAASPAGRNDGTFIAATTQNSTLPSCVCFPTSPDIINDSCPEHGNERHSILNPFRFDAITPSRRLSTRRFSSPSSFNSSADVDAPPTLPTRFSLSSQLQSSNIPTARRLSLPGNSSSTTMQVMTPTNRNVRRCSSSQTPPTLSKSFKKALLRTISSIDIDSSLSSSHDDAHMKETVEVHGCNKDIQDDEFEKSTEAVFDAIVACSPPLHSPSSGTGGEANRNNFAEIVVSTALEIYGSQRSFCRDRTSVSTVETEAISTVVSEASRRNSCGSTLSIDRPPTCPRRSESVEDDLWQTTGRN